MKGKRGRDVGKYLLLLGNYSLRSTDHLAVPYLSSSSPSSTPSICVVRSENMKRRGGERKLEDRKQEEQEWDWGRDQTWLCWGHPSMFLVCCWFLCLLHISHLSVEWGSGGEVRTWRRSKISQVKKGERGEGRGPHRCINDKNSNLAKIWWT